MYSELRNMFDLAMAVALIQSNGLAERVNWQPSVLVEADQLRLPQLAVPRQVETVVNHRVVNRRQIIAGVSGGVMVAPGDVIGSVRGYDDDGSLARNRQAAPVKMAAGTWWWDAGK